MQDAEEMFNVELSFKRGMVNKGCFSREVIFQLKNNCLVEGGGGWGVIASVPGEETVYQKAQRWERA